MGGIGGLGRGGGGVGGGGGGGLNGGGRGRGRTARKEKGLREGKDSNILRSVLGLPWDLVRVGPVRLGKPIHLPGMRRVM